MQVSLRSRLTFAGTFSEALGLLMVDHLETLLLILIPYFILRSILSIRSSRFIVSTEAEVELMLKSTTRS